MPSIGWRNILLSINMNRAYILTLCLLLFLFTKGYPNKSRWVTQVEEAFDVEIVLDTNFEGTWKSVSYDEVSDTSRIQEYLQLLLVEYQKYPTGYLNHAHVHKLIICKNLRFQNQLRAAIPDPHEKALYLGIDTMYPQNYLIHVMHHELHHSAEYYLYGNMYHKWKKWSRKNDKDFEYGEGGASAYGKVDNGINYYALSHPRVGFLNIYGTTGEEEDRCEMVACIMNDPERKVLLSYCKEDKRLKRKAKLAIRQMNSVSGEKFITWRKIRR